MLKKGYTLRKKTKYQQQTAAASSSNDRIIGSMSMGATKYFIRQNAVK